MESTTYRPVDGETTRAEIGLGDLIRALGGLGNGEQAVVDQIAACLGFHAGQPSGEIKSYRSSQGAWNRTRITPRSPQQKPPNFAPKPTMPPLPELLPDLPENILQTELSILADTEGMPQEASLPPAIAASPPLQDEEVEIPPRARLFSNRKVRPILSEAIAQPTTGRDLDIPRLIDLSVHKKPLRTIPRTPRKTVRNGCQLLLDFSEPLMPWWTDMRELMEQFNQLLGDQLCRVYEFEGDPATATHWSENSGDTIWRPITNIPVVVATDLGVTRAPTFDLRPTAETWRQMAERCRRHQAPLIALVPVHPDRWHKGLPQWMRLIHWNPATTAAEIKHIHLDTDRVV